jgi:hypothetical protein
VRAPCLQMANLFRPKTLKMIWLHGWRICIWKMDSWSLNIAYTQKSTVTRLPFTDVRGVETLVQSSGSAVDVPRPGQNICRLRKGLSHVWILLGIVMLLARKLIGAITRVSANLYNLDHWYINYNCRYFTFVTSRLSHGYNRERRTKINVGRNYKIVWIIHSSVVQNSNYNQPGRKLISKNLPIDFALD